MYDIFPAMATRLSHLQELPKVRSICLIGKKSCGHHDKRSNGDIETILTSEAHRQREPATCLEDGVEGEQLLYDARYLSLAHLQCKQASPSDSHPSMCSCSNFGCCSCATGSWRYSDPHASADQQEGTHLLVQYLIYWYWTDFASWVFLVIVSITRSSTFVRHQVFVEFPRFGGGLEQTD